MFCQMSKENAMSKYIFVPSRPQVNLWWCDVKENRTHQTRWHSSTGPRSSSDTCVPILGAFDGRRSSCALWPVMATLSHINQGAVQCVFWHISHIEIFKGVMNQDSKNFLIFWNRRGFGICHIMTSWSFVALPLQKKINTYF